MVLVSGVFPTARIAILVDDPSEAGPYVIRVKVPDQVRLMPHTHREDRIYTVISGSFISVSATYSTRTS
jgi:hypothetical protein